MNDSWKKGKVMAEGSAAVAAVQSSRIYSTDCHFPHIHYKRSTAVITISENYALQSVYMLC